MISTYAHTVLQLGALYGIVALGVCVAFRFLSFPDLTVDGSFVLGAVVSAQFITYGTHWSIALLAASLAGFLAGTVTATIHRILGINKFFAGILVMMMLYSVNLRLLGGANLSIFKQSTLFSGLGSSDSVASLTCLVLVVSCAFFALILFHSWFGLRLRGLGNNAAALKVGWLREWTLMIVGIGLANSFAAVGGSLVTQYQRFVDVNMGLNVTIGGFAALFLGEALMVSVGIILGKYGTSRIRNWLVNRGSTWAVRGEILAAITGSLILFIVTSGTLYLGLPPSDLKFVTAFILVLGMVFRRNRTSYLLVPVSPFEQ